MYVYMLSKSPRGNANKERLCSVWLLFCPSCDFGRERRGKIVLINELILNVLVLKDSQTDIFFWPPTTPRPPPCHFCI